MTRAIPLALAALLMLLVAGAQGLLTDRWGRRNDETLAKAVELLPELPLKFGDWEGKDVAADPKQMKVAKVAGYVQRQYKNVKTGVMVDIFLASSPARSVAVHTPDRCYAAAGFKMVGDQQAVPLTFNEHPLGEFYFARFHKDEQEQQSNLRIYWGWNAGEGWVAPAYPKVAFAGAPVLFKLYAIRALQPGDESVTADPVVGFLAELLPLVDQQVIRPLFPQAASADVATHP